VTRSQPSRTPKAGSQRRDGRRIRASRLGDRATLRTNTAIALPDQGERCLPQPAPAEDPVLQ
jgi:hypothetical protein